jgi:replicative DNA helicase
MQHPYHKGKPIFTNEAHNILMLGSRDTGKAICVETDIPTLTGNIKMKDIKVGDSILSIDGTQTKVLGVYPQGMRDVYELHFSDGRALDVDEEHINCLYDINKRRIINISTKEILNNYK